MPENNRDKNWDIPTELKFTFTQENDCCDSGDFGQVLKVETQDGGGGNYLILSTERWALDPEEIDRFAALLKKCSLGHTGARSFFEEESPK